VVASSYKHTKEQSGKARCENPVKTALQMLEHLGAAHKRSTRDMNTKRARKVLFGQKEYPATRNLFTLFS
jgi:hypothetical protein